eukprot:TRINITY_DN2476_c3_g1_i2.p1 TRINITY_DN2476_c3_g1~~TRINITY_DN2476_c3_g1_i2.p1  ORF type:complete len:108 (-),score=6.72 TRINITY_DN2476_c3_g1_i2:593-916(-)
MGVRWFLSLSSLSFFFKKCVFSPSNPFTLFMYSGFYWIMAKGCCGRIYLGKEKGAGGDKEGKIEREITTIFRRKCDEEFRNEYTSSEVLFEQKFLNQMNGTNKRSMH